MKRDSFIFYKSFFDSIKELDLIDQARIYNAIFLYQFEGEKVELTGVCKSIFTLIIPQLEANNKRYVNGLKGGAPKNNQNARKKQPKNNLETTKKQPNENDNVNENDIRKETISKDIVKKRFIKPTIQEIADYCKERNNSVDADKFFNFYESKDWYIGKNKMKDWKACVRTWEQKESKRECIVPEWFNRDIKKENENEERKKLAEQLTNGTYRP